MNLSWLVAASIVSGPRRLLPPFGNTVNPNTDLDSKKGHGIVFILKITIHNSIHFLQFPSSQVTKQEVPRGLLSLRNMTLWCL